MTTPNMSLDEIWNEVREWAEAKGFDDPGKQLLKHDEEYGELVSAFLKGKGHHEVQDGVGDTVVPLMVFCAVTGYDFRECLNIAWGVVRERTGEMRDGVFVKAEDL